MEEHRKFNKTYLNMDHTEKDSKLFQEFPPISTKEWEDKIIADLKGADYNKKLVWRTMEGFNVKPYYRAEDLENLNHLDTMPGEFPYTRGFNKKDNKWLIRQNIKVKDIKATNEKALELLCKGVEALGFNFDDNYEPTTQDIEEMLEGVYAEMVELNFDTAGASHLIISIIEELTEKYERDPEKIHGSVNFDPYRNLIKKGRFCRSEEHIMKTATQMISAAENLPNYRVLAINGNIFHNSGSSIVEELAFSLAQGADLISKLVDLGLSVDEISSRIKFNFAVGSNYFMEMAKMRAARMLWAQVVKAYEPKSDDACKIHVHAITSDWNKSLYDPYVNMLRTTTEAMSAAIAGVESLTVRPFNEVYEDTTEFSERIARNQQLLLKEESYFDRIADPAAGSYYIESLTNSIAEQAWALFLEIEEAGGFLEAFKKGMIQDKIKATAQKRDLNIALRREKFVGTNQFPNFTEALTEEVSQMVINPIDESDSTTQYETLKPYRGAMAFERLRYATDMAVKDGKKRPLAFMLTIGHLAMRKARSEFSRNFFAIAGFEVMDNNGFATIDEGIAAAKEAGADIIVICSSDDEYATLAPELNEKLNKEAILVVAGAPACSDDLKAVGVTNFINVRTNALEELTRYQKELGI